MPKTSTTQRDVYPWAIVAFQSAAIFLEMTVSLMLGPMLVELAREFDTTVAVAGQLVTATYVAWGLSALLVGPFSDIYGRRRVMLTGITLSAVGVVASGFAWDYASLLVTRLVSGAGASMILPTGMAAISDHFPSQSRGRAIGLVLVAASLAAAVGVPLVAFITDMAGWRWVFYTLGASLVALWAVFLAWFPRSGAQKSGGTAIVLAHYKALLKTRQMWFLVAGNIFQRVPFFGAFTYMAVYLMQTYGKTEGQVALPLAVAGLGMVLGSLLGGDMAVRPRRLTFVAVLIVAGGALSAALYLLAVGLWASAALAMGMAALLYASMPTLVSLVNDVGGELRGTAMGFFATSNQLGGVLGASLGGLALSLGGFSAASVLFLVSSLLSAVLLTVLVRESTAFRQGVRAGKATAAETSTSRVPR